MTQTNCPYCHYPYKELVFNFEDYEHLFIQKRLNGYFLNAYYGGESHRGEIPYCPMCGRKLEVK